MSTICSSKTQIFKTNTRKGCEKRLHFSFGEVSLFSKILTIIFLFHANETSKIPEHQNKVN